MFWGLSKSGGFFGLKDDTALVLHLILQDAEAPNTDPRVFPVPKTLEFSIEININSNI